MPSTVVMYLMWTMVPLGAYWLVMVALRVGPADIRRGGGTGVVALDAHAAFDDARARHVRWWLEMHLTGRGRAVDLPRLQGPYGRRGLRPAGEHEVPIALIVGSVDGGRHPFDRRFDPSQDDAWPRFLSVFQARAAGVSLPPVELYRTGDGYFVLDGHHRVAVAQAFGDTTIRAEVTDVLD